MNFSDEFARQLQSRDYGRVIVETTIMILINLAALCGNLMVCWAVYKNRRLRTVPNIYVVSLAISDILMASLSIPYSCVVLATGRWIFGQLFCQIQGFFTFFLAFVSLQTMTATAVNRYFTVVKPTVYRTSTYFTVKYTIYTVVLVCFSASFGAGLAFGWADFTLHYGKVFCFPQFPFPEDEKGYIAFVDVVYILFSFNILSFCYFQIFRTVRAHKRSLSTSREATARSHLSISEINVTKVLFATVLAFTICWTPIVIIDLTVAISAHSVRLPRQLYLMYIYLGYGSSSVNPIIYGIMNRSFRIAFLKIFPCPCSSRVHPRFPLEQSIGGMDTVTRLSTAKTAHILPNI